MSSLRDELQAIYDAHGKLTPKIVVDEARDDEHPLHPQFEWDDAVAGEKYRQHQARALIQSVKIKYRNGDKLEEVRYFQSVRREDGHSYEPTEKVIEDEVTREILLRDMEREWRQLLSRYSRFKEFVELVKRDLEAA